MITSPQRTHGWGPREDSIKKEIIVVTNYRWHARGMSEERWKKILTVEGLSVGSFDNISD